MKDTILQQLNETKNFLFSKTILNILLRTFTFRENITYILNRLPQKTIQSVCFILIIMIRIIIVSVFLIEIVVIICYRWRISANFALTNNCAHHNAGSSSLHCIKGSPAVSVCQRWSTKSTELTTFTYKTSLIKSKGMAMEAYLAYSKKMRFYFHLFRVE